MTIGERPSSAEAYDQWIAQPEKADCLFEFIAGEVVESICVVSPCR